jgi:hypothetical protein
MSRPAREREEDAELATREPEPEPEPAPALAPGSMAWASAVGNQAVQRLAREQSVAREPAVEDVEEAPEEELDLSPDEAEGLAALDDLDQDELPE